MSKFPSVPAYSFQGKHQGGNPSDQPGPGAYDYGSSEKLTTRRSPTFAMGKAGRDSLIKSEAPGPGAYDGNIFSKPNGAVILGKGKGLNGSDGPGPGAYDNGDLNKLRVASGGFSFGKGPSHPGLKGSLSPGPGAYYDADKYTSLNKSHGNALARAARNYLQPSDSPGPGAYDQSSGLFGNKKGPVMSKSPRDGIGRKGASEIGPGGYDVGREFDKPSKRGYVMDKAARGINKGGDAPGPGAYDVDSAFNKFSHKQGGTAFSKSPRAGLNADGLPGPGAYELHNGAFDQKKGKGFISKQGRDGLKVSDAPGPGAYEDVDAFNRLSSAKGGIKFAKSSSHDHKSEVPGPGAYDGSGVKSKGGISFPKDPRDHAHTSEIPGPGAYDMYGGIAPNPSKYTFTKAPRDKNSANNGPGYYDVPATIPDVAKYNYPPPNARKIHL